MYLPPESSAWPTINSHRLFSCSVRFVRRVLSPDWSVWPSRAPIFPISWFPAKHLAAVATQLQFATSCKTVSLWLTSLFFFNVRISGFRHYDGFLSRYSWMCSEGTFETVSFRKWWVKTFWQVLLRKCFFGEQLLDFALNSHLLLARSLKLHLLALLLRVPSNAMRCAHFDAHQHCALVLITWALHGAVHP